MPDLQTMALDLVAREAQHLDRQEWTEWLDLYTDDARIWAPMWVDESTLTSDPDTELSFMYLEGRHELKERVDRVTSGLSVASLPVPRVCHVLGRGLVKVDPGTHQAVVNSSWMSCIYHHKSSELIHYAGQYEHSLRWVDGEYRIFLKKIVTINDRLRSQVEFFYF